MALSIAEKIRMRIDAGMTDREIAAAGFDLDQARALRRNVGRCNEYTFDVAGVESDLSQPNTKAADAPHS